MFLIPLEVANGVEGFPLRLNNEVKGFLIVYFVR
jgi:hypothetical protein